MEDNTEQPSPVKKFYTERIITGGTFAGGPLVAGYALAENFKALNQPEKVRPTWIISILSTIFILGGALLIPDDVNFPNVVIPAAYAFIAGMIYRKTQHELIKEQFQSAGAPHKWWKIIGPAIISLVVIFVTALLSFIILDLFAESTIQAKLYGGSIQHEIEYDIVNIPENEVDALAEAFIATGFFDQSVTKFVFVEKDKSGYWISIYAVEGIENSSEGLDFFRVLKSQLEKLLPNSDLKLKLVVGELSNVVSTIE